jgi:hypothetical protein
MERPNQAPVTTTTAPHPGLLRDIFNGAVLGEYADYLGVAGICTQILLGYVPVIGTLCAARDLLADRRHGDNLGTLLNFLALFPVLGGFPKTAEVLEHARHLHEARKALQRRRQQGAPSDSASTMALTSTSLLMALMAPLVVPLLCLGAVALLVPLLHMQGRAVEIMLLAIGFAMPLLIVVMGHIERRERAKGSHARRPGTLVGLFLGYCYLLVMLAISSIVLTFH